MGGDKAPPAVVVHPYVGEAIAVFVRLAFLDALFVICAGDHCSVAVHANLEIGHIRYLHVHGRVSSVGDISRLAEGASILNRDDVVVGEQREFIVAMSPRL
jgi:hypothetical protein